MRHLADPLFVKLGANTKEERWLLFKQIFMFGLVGLSNTLISWACYYIVLYIREDLYLMGGLIGAMASIANAFFWNDRFVFKGNERDWKSKLKRFGKTYVSYGGTSLLGLLLTWIEANVFLLPKVILPPLNLIITIPLNFVINKFWTFGTAG